MAKTDKNKSDKEASNLFHNIMAASVKNKENSMTHHQIEKIPVSNGNVYQLRVVEYPLSIHAEINIEASGGKLKNIETVQFGSEEDVEDVKEKVRKYIVSKSMIEDIKEKNPHIKVGKVTFNHSQK